VERNYVEGAVTDAGINVGGGPAIVRNNIVVGNQYHGIWAQDYNGRGLQQNVWIVHNTVLNNPTGGIKVSNWLAGAGNVLAFNAIAPLGGTPALTATSGPGLSLMIEALGLATSAEIPIVVIDVMRGGPSTGIPAKSEQSDLSFAVSGLTGDAPRLVLAPTSIADCLDTTQWAVQLAEAMQAPAIVLSDQFMGQSRSIIDRLVANASATRAALLGH